MAAEIHRLPGDSSPRATDAIALSTGAVAICGSLLRVSMSDDATVWLLAAIATAGLAALSGIVRFRRRHTPTLLWVAIGLNAGLGVVGLLSFGIGSLLVAIVSMGWLFVTAHREGLPALSRRDLLLEALAFLLIVGTVDRFVA